MEDFLTKTANSTPTGVPSLGDNIIKAFGYTSKEEIPKATITPSGKLSGPTTIKSAPPSIGDILPKNAFGQSIRDVFDEVKTFVFDEPRVQKIDRLAESLITTGVDRNRAYEIALNKQVLSGVSGMNNLAGYQNAQKEYKNLAVTPEEEQTMSSAIMINNLLTGLTVAGFAPGKKIIASGVLKNITIGNVERRVPIQLAEEIEMTRSMLDALEATSKERVGALTKYTSKTGEFKGQLNLNTGKGKFAKDAENLLAEQYDTTMTGKYADDMAEQFNAERTGYKKVKETLARLESEAKAYKPTVTPKSVADDIYENLPPEQKAVTETLEESVKKVGNVRAIDWLDTPEYVYRRIGLGEEFDMLRKGWEQYTRDIKANISKVDDWAKRVPKESNQRIFDYLDGQDIVLNANEKAVAQEIRVFLKDWADKLGIPQEGRVTDYITRLFDDEISKGNIDDKLKKIVSGTIKDSVYNPYLEKRIGAAGYKRDTWAALDAYVSKATLKTNMDEAFKALQAKTGTTFNAKIDDLTFKYIQSHMDSLMFKPTDIDRLLDRTVSSIAQKLGLPDSGRFATSALYVLRKLQYGGSLGLRLGTSLLNLQQGVNTYSRLGEKYTIIGYSKMLNPRLRAELEDVGILADSFIEDRELHNAGKVLKALDKGLFYFFQEAEYINRGSAYFGAKAKALANGATEAEAIEAGKKLVRETQFLFGPLDSPLAIRSQLAKSIAQFQTYNIKQTRFLGEMVSGTMSGKDKLKYFVQAGRYILGTIVFYNTIGKLFGMTPEQTVPVYRFGIPPSWKALYETGRAALDLPDKFGRERTTKQKLSDIGNAAVGLFPGGRQIKSTVEGIQAVKEGGAFTDANKLKFQTPKTTLGQMKTIIFGPNATKEAQDYFNRAETKKKEQEIMRPTYDKVIELASQGKTEEAKDILRSLSKKQLDVYKDIHSAEKQKQTDKLKKEMLPYYRQIEKLKSEGNIEKAREILLSLDSKQLEALKKLKKSLEED